MTDVAPPSFDKVVRGLRETFESGRTRPLAWREQQLRGLSTLLVEHEAELVDALPATDLGRPAMEAWLADVRASGREVEHTLKHLRRWAGVQRVRPPWQLAVTRTRVVREPLGVASIIAPWNYPIYLTISPLAAALAAGNTVVVKPSELTPTVSAALARLLPMHVDDDALAVVEGGPDETQALLAERFDHILYTGNGRVGRIVMEAAAKHLTPVTLELGGKSPVIVAADASIKVAAKRIAFGKFLNAGQTCIAPDYVLVERSAEQPLLDALRSTIAGFYGDDPQRSDSFGRIVNERHFDRLAGLLDGGGYAATAVGGTTDRSDRFVAPTVLAGVEPDAPVMQEEIFGPILPVIAVDSVDDAIRFVNERDKPLALYVFTNDGEVRDRVLDRTSSGGACVNDVTTHVLVNDLPFGGVGASGMGAYHGQWGFETFSHRKAVFDRPIWFELPALLPPYRAVKEKLMRRLL